eukprot:TRINITY_DN19881_c0_g1_i1.p1 TRINITY_DN19881_c0_g1~~TRINITY_DN19881_c0_g1_i1.p1  ORF type:complete len:681 (+),score=97.70 TRINITY_DN19881_c0_g1_i1:119-2161(+)
MQVGLEGSSPSQRMLTKPVGRSTYYKIDDERHGYWVLCGKTLCHPAHVWRVKVDRATGLEFYVNVLTRQKVWRLPEVAGGGDPDADTQATATSPPRSVRSAGAEGHPPVASTLALGAVPFMTHSYASPPPLHRPAPTTAHSPLAAVMKHRQRSPAAQPLPTPAPRSPPVSSTASTGSAPPANPLAPRPADDALLGVLRNVAGEADASREMAAAAQRACDQLREQVTSVTAELRHAQAEISSMRAERGVVAAAAEGPRAPPARTRALVVGVGHQTLGFGFAVAGCPGGRRVPDAQAVADAAAMAQVLGQHGEVTTLVDNEAGDVGEYPTRDRIIQSVEGLVAAPEAGAPPDQAVLYMRGQGSAAGNGLLPYDCGTQGALCGQRLSAALANAAAPRVVVLADVPQTSFLFDLPYTIIPSVDGGAAWVEPDAAPAALYPCEVWIVGAVTTRTAPTSEGGGSAAPHAPPLTPHYLAAFRTAAARAVSVLELLHALSAIDPALHETVPYVACTRPFAPLDPFPLFPVARDAPPPLNPPAPLPLFAPGAWPQASTHPHSAPPPAAARALAPNPLQHAQSMSADVAEIRRAMLPDVCGTDPGLPLPHHHYPQVAAAALPLPSFPAPPAAARPEAPLPRDALHSRHFSPHTAHPPVRFQTAFDPFQRPAPDAAAVLSDSVDCRSWLRP